MERAPTGARKEKKQTRSRPVREQGAAESGPAERILDAFQEFAGTYGQTGARLLTERLKEHGTLRLEDVRDVIKEVPPVEEFREDVLKALVSLGALKREGQTWIADLDAISALVPTDFEKSPHRISQTKYKHYLGGGFVHALFEALGHLHVVSTEDRKKKRAVSRPLFYVPQDPKAALDPDTIRADESYLGFWELGKGSPDRWKAPAYPGAGTEIGFREASLAALVYHPRYGRGYRTEDGTLMVYDPDEKTHVPVTKDWFTRKMGFASGNASRGELTMHLSREYLDRYAPHLQERGLLTREDFRQHSTTVNSPTATGRVERNSIGSTGQVMLYGVSHYLGREFGGQENRGKIKVYEVSPGMGGIVRISNDGTERLTHTFRMFREGEAGPKRVKFGPGKERGYAGADLTAVTPIGQLQERAMGEAQSQFQERVRDAERFQAFLQTSNGLWRNADVRLADLPPATQLWVTDAVEHLEPERQEDLYKFGKTYGLDGVKALFSAEIGGVNGAEDILSLAERLGAPLMRSVIKRYNAILSLTERTADDLAHEVFAPNANVPSLDARALQQDLLRRAAAVLVEAARVSEEPDVTAERIIERLDRHERDLALFASVFKTAFKGKSSVTFEDMRGVELSARTRDELEPGMEQAMLTAARENWKQDPELRDLPVEALKEKLHGTTDDSLFYLLQKDRRLLAFMRFDERPDGNLYAGSLNVNPTLRGSAVGETFLDACLDRAAGHRAVHADFFPQVDAGMMYVDRLGWAVTGVERVRLPDGKAVRRCAMVRKPEWQDAFLARQSNVEKEYLMSLAGQDQGPFHVEQFRFPGDRERFMDAVERAGAQRLAMTRYFSAPNNPDVRFAVFEPLPSSAKPHKNSK